MSRSTTFLTACGLAAFLAACGGDGGGGGTDPQIVLFTSGATVDVDAAAALGDVAFADLNGDGALDLIATTDAGNVSVALGTGAGAFAAPVDLPVGGALTVLATADFDADGDLDVAVLDETADRVVILTNDGSGTLLIGPIVDFDPGADLSDLAVVDADLDGDLDLVILNAGDGEVAVALNSAGSFVLFATPISLDATLGTATVVTVGDFDSDGVPDVAVGGTNGRVEILIADGLGGATGTVLVVDAGVTVTGLVAADFDEDGDLDVAVSDVSGHVHLLVNDGTGTFTVGVGIPAAATASGLVAADFDLDGHVDLAVAADADVAILLGNGNGTFDAALLFSGGGDGAIALAVGDLDCDGSLDLLVANALTGSVGVLLGVDHSISASFAPGVEIPLGLGVDPDDVVVADVNADGDADLLVTNALTGALVVALGNGNGTFDAATSFVTGVVGARALATGDVDLDGDLDVVVAVGTGVTSAIVVLEGDGTGSFSVGATVSTGSSSDPDDVVLVDLDADGDLDIVAVADDDVVVALGGGDGTFAAAVPTDLGVGFDADAIVAGDWDRDGDLDVAVVSEANGTVAILPGNGNGTFGAPDTVTIDASAPFDELTDVAAGDLDCDGDLDLVVTNETSGSLHVLENDGTGTFTVTQTVAATSDASAVALGDVDRDGDLDALVTSGDEASVALLLNDGNATFTFLGNLPTSATDADSVFVADVNHDGRLDVITANALLDLSASVLFNVGN